MQLNVWNDLAKAKRRWKEKKVIHSSLQHAIERVERPGESQEASDGKKESSRHPSPFCSITVPKRGTSIVVFRLICGRLQCHVSGARRPRFATSARASNLGWSLRGRTSSLMMRRSPCMGSAAVLATVSSSNQVRRKDLTPMSVLELRHLISSRRRLWYTGGTIQAGINTFNVANIPRYIDPCLLKLCRDASHLSFYGFDE